MKTHALNLGKIKQIPFLPHAEDTCESRNENIPLYAGVCTFNYQCQTQHIPKLTLSPNHELFNFFHWCINFTSKTHHFHSTELPLWKCIPVRWGLGGKMYVKFLKCYSNSVFVGIPFKEAIWSLWGAGMQTVSVMMVCHSTNQSVLK